MEMLFSGLSVDNTHKDRKLFTNKEIRSRRFMQNRIGNDFSRCGHYKNIL